MLLEGTEGLHQRPFKIRTDTHDFTSRFHLRRQRPFRLDKFIERKSWDLHDTVIKSRLKTGKCLARHRVRDLIERVAERDLCRHFRDRIPRRLRRKSRRAAHAGIDLNNTVFKRFGVKGKLHVASSGDVKFRNDTQRRRAEHLIFFIGKRLGRRYDDAVPGVNADWIQVFHIADRDAVSAAVAHDLVFNFFPAGDTPLDQALPNAGQTESVCANFAQFFLIFSDPAAAPPERIRRTDDDRIPDRICKCHGILYGFYDLACRDRLPDLLHRLFELQTVFRPFDRLGRRTDQTHLLFCQKTGLI